MLREHYMVMNTATAWKAGLLVLITVICLYGCSRPVATVDGKKIRESVFDLHLREKIQDHRAQNASPDVRKLRESVLQELIIETLILEEAEKEGISVTDEELDRELVSIRRGIDDEQLRTSLLQKGLTLEDFRSRTRDKMTMAKFITFLSRDVRIDEEEMREHYANRNLPFIRPGRVLVKMIELPSLEDAGRVADEMKRTKADFDVMASRLEREQKAVVIGYGWVNPDMLSSQLAVALKNLGKGRQGGPYRGTSRYYLVKIRDREPEGIAKYEEVKENIRKTLADQKRQQALSQWIRQRRSSAKIEIHMM